MLRRTPLQRKTRLRARRNKPEVVIGKVSGKVRLSGRRLKQLREQVYTRDKGICQCGCGRVAYFRARFEGDPHAYDMAHIVSRGAGGADSLENCRTMLHMCHMSEHLKGRKQ